jgi:hypothetical protein
LLCCRPRTWHLFHPNAKLYTQVVYGGDESHDEEQPHNDSNMERPPRFSHYPEPPGSELVNLLHTFLNHGDYLDRVYNILEHNNWTIQRLMIGDRNKRPRLLAMPERIRIRLELNILGLAQLMEEGNMALGKALVLANLRAQPADDEDDLIEERSDTEKPELLPNNLFRFPSQSNPHQSYPSLERGQMECHADSSVKSHCVQVNNDSPRQGKLHRPYPDGTDCCHPHPWIPDYCHPLAPIPHCCHPGWNFHTRHFD